MIKILLTLSLFALCWLFTTIGVRRWRAYRELSAEREAAQAALIIGARRDAAHASKPADAAAEPRPSDATSNVVNSTSPTTLDKDARRADVHFTVDAESNEASAAFAVQNASRVVDTRSEHADAEITPVASDDDAPLSFDAAGLKQMRPCRFARICIAYFECTGFKARKFTGDAPIDALLFLGDSQTPMMALRWARSSDHPASSSEVIKFGMAAAQLRIQHAHFLAPRGTTLNATKAAVEQSVSIINAEHLAAKIAALPPQHLRVLMAAGSD